MPQFNRRGMAAQSAKDSRVAAVYKEGGTFQTRNAVGSGKELGESTGVCLVTGNLADFPEPLRGKVEVVSAADYVAWLERVSAG